jgi:hypothetical protein
MATTNTVFVRPRHLARVAAFFKLNYTAHFGADTALIARFFINLNQSH